MTTRKVKPIVVSDSFLIKESPFEQIIEYKIQKSCIWERRVNNSGNVEIDKSGFNIKRSKKDRDEFLIIGFDSEYKTPNYSLSNYEIKKGRRLIRFRSEDLLDK